MRITTLGVALAALLAVVPAAHAGPITYEKGGDLWLAQPDGSGQRQVTTGGGYLSPSLADDGTIVAAYGTRLRRLRADGTVLSDIATVVANANWRGPLEPDVSPDGTKIVYEWEYRHDQELPGCPLSEQECRDRMLGGGSVVSWSDRATGREELGRYEDSEPTFVDDTRLLMRSPTLGLPVWAPVPGGGGRLLFDVNVKLWDPTATRGGGMFAFVTQNARSFIAVWKTDGAFPGGGRPTGCFSYQGPNGRFDDLSFSPDGDQLIWQEDDGIWSGIIDNGCAPPKTAPRLLIAGGRSPDFGGPPKPPPPPPPEERRPPVEQPPVPRPPVERPPVIVVPAARAPQLALAGKAPSLRTLAKRRALTLKLTCDGACDVRLTASLTRALAKKLRLKSTAVASAKAKGSGALTVKLTLSRSVAAALAKQKKAVTVTVAGSGSYGSGARAAPRVTLTLKR